MVGSFEIHPLEKPKAESPNMLSNDERINPNYCKLRFGNVLG